MTEPSERDPLAFDLNLRDVGGHATSDGAKVATGVAYRSAALGGMSDEARTALAGLSLRHVFDLRTAAEQEELPDELPAGASLVVLDVFADASDLAPARLRSLFDDPAAATELLQGDVVREALKDAYRRLVNLPSARTSYRQLFSSLADPTTGPAVFHCTAGKDRTGWAAAVLLSFLGVPRDAVVADFLAGNAATVRAFQPQLDAFAAAGGDPAVLIPMFEVQVPNLDAAFAEVTTQFDTVEGYLTAGLGLSVDTLTALRARFLR